MDGRARDKLSEKNFARLSNLHLPIRLITGETELDNNTLTKMQP